MGTNHKADTHGIHKELNNSLSSRPISLMLCLRVKYTSIDLCVLSQGLLLNISLSLTLDLHEHPEQLGRVRFGPWRPRSTIALAKKRMTISRNASSESSKGSASLQKKLADARQAKRRPEPLPDLTDFMNDMFFGTVEADKKAYNLSGAGGMMTMEEDEGFDDSRRSNSSRMTQQWLDEAKRMVAASPARCDSPSRLVGSPRFAAAQPSLSATTFDRRDPLSRSARRYRAAGGFSGEIISKSAKHSRDNSESLASSAVDISPASAVQKWFSNILKPSNPTLPSPSFDTNTATPPRPAHSPIADPTLPLPQPTHRKSRFQNDPSAPQSPQIPTPQSKRTFGTTATPAPPSPDKQLLSPPKSLVESARRRAISSSTCSFPENQPLSPPRNSVGSAHRRSISTSTDKDSRKPYVNGVKDADRGSGVEDLNGFLRDQRTRISKILNGEINAEAKIVLSGPSNTTSSMLLAICYAWLLENRMRMKKDRVEEEESVVVVPVLNLRREKMWKQLQAAWLFHHVGVDATALLFCDEVDLESLMMEKKLSILIVGQDILSTNGEVGSQCTILTDNYCEDAYDLLQTPQLKKLLLAGILLDTQNLNTSTKLSLSRDAEAVLLLSVGSAPNYRNSLYDKLMQDQTADDSFIEVLEHIYGMAPNEGSYESRAPEVHRISERKSYHDPIMQNSNKNSNHAKNVKTNTAPPKPEKPKSIPDRAPAAQSSDTSRGKSKFFLAKWFGFSSK